MAHLSSETPIGHLEAKVVSAEHISSAVWREDQTLKWEVGEEDDDPYLCPVSGKGDTYVWHGAFICRPAACVRMPTPLMPK